MSGLYCVVATNALTASVLKENPVKWPWTAHLAGCLRCQAHLASVKATRRRLRDMRADMVSPPTELLENVTLAMDLHASASVTAGTGRRRAAASAAIAAAALAAAWMWRRAQDRSVEVWT